MWDPKISITWHHTAGYINHDTRTDEAGLGKPRGRPGGRPRSYINSCKRKDEASLEDGPRKRMTKEKKKTKKQKKKKKKKQKKKKKKKNISRCSTPVGSW